MIRALIILISCSLLATTAFAMNWTRDSEPSHGLSFAYPQDVFFPVAGDQKPSFRYYSDGKAAKLLIGSWTNENRMAPSGVKNWMIDNTGGYDEKKVPEPRSDLGTCQIGAPLHFELKVNGTTFLR